YDGKHYGIVTWAQVGFPKDYHFYNITSYKQDFNLYCKIQQNLSDHWQGFGDIQVRDVKYDINGFRNNPQLIIKKNYLFINPKLGITYNKNNYQAYLSYSMAGKEPNRDDFEAGLNQQPKAEILHDIELGFEKKTLNYSYGATAYYMYYHNQLVLSGKINDVGEYTRTNTPSSYRLGIELEGKANLLPWINASANIAFSRNKIKNFTEYVDAYDNGGQKTFQYQNTDISFSPNIVAASTINFLPVKNAELSLLSKYVGREFLDNTSKSSRSLNPFFVQDVRLRYTIINKISREINFTFQLNNIFNTKYEPNGYTFSYLYSGNLTTENFYFPMAGTNFMAAINIKF
ncbi:MAG: TonB-dependent receptor, partial [Chitinophagaceae bacterium]